MMDMVHAPGHLREAFQDLVDENWEHYEHIFEDEDMPVETLLWRLASCSDVMPGSLCEVLALPRGSTYAMGVGALIVRDGMFLD